MNENANHKDDFNFDASFEDAAWLEMRKLLDEEMPEKAVGWWQMKGLWVATIMLIALAVKLLFWSPLVLKLGAFPVFGEQEVVATHSETPVLKEEKLVPSSSKPNRKSATIDNKSSTNSNYKINKKETLDIYKNNLVLNKKINYQNDINQATANPILNLENDSQNTIKQTATETTNEPNIKLTETFFELNDLMTTENNTSKLSKENYTISTSLPTFINPLPTPASTINMKLIDALKRPKQWGLAVQAGAFSDLRQYQGLEAGLLIFRKFRNPKWQLESGITYASFKQKKQGSNLSFNNVVIPDLTTASDPDAEETLGLENIDPVAITPLFYQQLNYLQIPLAVSYQASTKWSFQTGIKYGRLLNSKVLENETLTQADYIRADPQFIEDAFFANTSRNSYGSKAAINAPFSTHRWAASFGVRFHLTHQLVLSANYAQYINLNISSSTDATDFDIETAAVNNPPLHPNRALRLSFIYFLR